MIYPVRNPKVTSPYGYRTDPITGKAGVFHDGIDFISESDDKSIFAIHDGIVGYIFNKYNYLERWDLSKESAAGNYLVYSILLNNKIFYIKPLHFDKINNYKIGDKIHEGDILGEYGNVGYSSGAHTHLYCYNESWKVINPDIVLRS